MVTTSHRSAKWEISGSALGSALKGTLGNRSGPWGAQGNWLCSRECSDVERQQEENSREHSLEHPQFPLARAHTKGVMQPHAS